MQRRRSLSSHRFGAARSAAAGVAMALALALGGCAASRDTYMGIPLVVGEAPLLVQLLAAKAKKGDKLAQLHLGECFERGFLVPVDLERARTLYAEAARDSGGTTWVYVPPVGKQGRGQVIPVNTGPVVHGLPEAKARLESLNKKRDQPQESEALQADALPATPNDAPDAQ